MTDIECDKPCVEANETAVPLEFPTGLAIADKCMQEDNDIKDITDKQPDMHCDSHERSSESGSIIPDHCPDNSNKNTKYHTVY